MNGRVINYELDYEINYEINFKLKSIVDYSTRNLTNNHKITYMLLFILIKCKRKTSFHCKLFLATFLGSIVVSISTGKPWFEPDCEVFD
jgi:hypothetical protein